MTLTFYDCYNLPFISRIVWQTLGTEEGKGPRMRLIDNCIHGSTTPRHNVAQYLSSPNTCAIVMRVHVIANTDNIGPVLE